MGTTYRLALILVSLIFCDLISWSAYGFQDDAKAPHASEEIIYHSNRLGIRYFFVQYDGHLGIKIKDAPSLNSPFSKLVWDDGSPTYLEPGDVIINIDDLVIDGPDDLENHIARTEINFINSRNGKIGHVTTTFPPLSESSFLYALFIIDTNSKLAGLANDRDNMKFLIDHHIQAKRGTLTILEGNNVNKSKIKNYFQRLGNCSGKTVMVYYSGHGATDPQRGHALTLDNGEILLRSELRSELAKHTPRLTILLTDACGSVVTLFRARAPLAGEPPDFKRNSYSLFFKTSGIVDINAASPTLNELAWGAPDGGLFSTAVLDTILLDSYNAMDRNHDGLLTWKECLPTMRKRTKQNYTEYKRDVLANGNEKQDTIDSLREQLSQTPFDFNVNQKKK